MNQITFKRLFLAVYSFKKSSGFATHYFYFIEYHHIKKKPLFYFNGVKNWKNVKTYMEFDLLQSTDKSFTETLSPFLPGRWLRM